MPNPLFSMAYELIKILVFCYSIGYTILFKCYRIKARRFVDSHGFIFKGQCFARFLRYH